MTAPILLADRPDPTPEEREKVRRADQIALPDLLKAFAWTVEELDIAIGREGFPKPTGRVGTKLAPIGDPVYSKAQIVAWRQQKIGFLRSLEKVKL
jgi:hypothetical protein